MILNANLIQKKNGLNWWRI